MGCNHISRYDGIHMYFVSLFLAQVGSHIVKQLSHIAERFWFSCQRCSLTAYCILITNINIYRLVEILVILFVFCQLYECFGQGGALFLPYSLYNKSVSIDSRKVRDATNIFVWVKDGVVFSLRFYLDRVIQFAFLVGCSLCFLIRSILFIILKYRFKLRWREILQ